MSHRTRTILDALLILVGTLIALEAIAFALLVGRTVSREDIGLAQAAAQCLAQHPWNDREIETVDPERVFSFHPTTQYAYEPHASFHGLQIGRHGFILNSVREPEDFPRKPAGLTRIVVLGGSSAAGATVTGNDKTLSAQLEALLNAEGEARFQVLNFAMGGNYSYGELQRLITEVAHLQPDAVIFLDGFNDAFYANFQHLREELEAPLMNWADFSYHFFDAMAGLGEALRPPPPVMTYAYLWVATYLRGIDPGSVQEQRRALYRDLPSAHLSAWVAERDPTFRSALATNLDFAAAWAARNGVWLFAYLQPIRASTRISPASTRPGRI